MRICQYIWINSKPSLFAIGFGKSDPESSSGLNIHPVRYVPNLFFETFIGL